MNVLNVLNVLNAFFLWKSVKFEKSCIFLFRFAKLFVIVGEMTPKEFEHKVKEMRTQALNAARGFGLPMEEAEDVAQDVMLRLWAIHERIGVQDPVGWLARIAAKHACIDWFRGRHQAKDFEQSEADVGGLTPHDALEYQELEKWLLRQIEQLPTTCGIVLRMRQLEHREVEEIATLLGITKPTVSTLLSRARHQLLEQLKRRNQE